MPSSSYEFKMVYHNTYALNTMACATVRLFIIIEIGEELDIRIGWTSAKGLNLEYWIPLQFSIH